MLSSQAAQWSGVRATIIRRERTAGVSQRFKLPWHAFRLGISGAFERGSTTRLGPLRAVPLATQAGGASFYPAHTDIANEVAGASRLSYLMVEIDRDFANDAGQPRGGELLPVPNLIDPLCCAVLAGLRREVEQPASASSLFAETAAMMLLLAVARAQSHRADGVEQRRGGLSANHLARVTDYMRDRLEGDLTLLELAGSIGLSRSHLCRAFKASTGTTLHRWQTNARVERAKELLASGQLSLADVAAATGFADQSHFTTAFRRLVGTTPGAWRRAR